MSYSQTVADGGGGGGGVRIIRQSGASNSAHFIWNAPPQQLLASSSLACLLVTARNWYLLMKMLGGTLSPLIHSPLPTGDLTHLTHSFSFSTSRLQALTLNPHPEPTSLVPKLQAPETLNPEP